LSRLTKGSRAATLDIKRHTYVLFVVHWARALIASMVAGFHRTVVFALLLFD